MTWLLWRQHRVQAGLAVALLAAFAVPVWITGQNLADQLAACRAGTTCGELFQGYQGINVLVDLSVIVPMLVGIFFGATVVGRDLETGTASLAWTQSVTRRRWLTTKLLTLFGLTGLVSFADTVLVTWWSNAHNATVESRFSGLQFDIQGLAPVGYALFASAVGLAASVLWRRTLPAMATTVGAFIGVRFVVELMVRPHYLTPVTRISSLDFGADVPAGAWPVSQDIAHNGHVVSGAVRLPETCAAAGSRVDANRCLEHAGYTFRSTFQPAGRYWTFQWIEFGIFVALAAVCIALGVAVLSRRDA